MTRLLEPVGYFKQVDPHAPAYPAGWPTTRALLFLLNELKWRCCCSCTCCYHTCVVVVQCQWVFFFFWHLMAHNSTYKCIYAAPVVFRRIASQGTHVTHFCLSTCISSCDAPNLALAVQVMRRLVLLSRVNFGYISAKLCN